MTNFSSDTPPAAGVLRIQTTYLHETFRALCRFNDLLHDLGARAEDRALWDELLAVADRIRDLAMIHGFDGVEKITTTIASSLRDSLRGGSPLEAATLERIESAALAIKDIAEAETALEQHMTVERISRDAEVWRQKVEDCASQLTGPDADAPVAEAVKVIGEEGTPLPPAGKAADPPAPMFDISEFDFVLRIVDDSGETSTEPSHSDREPTP